MTFNNLPWWAWVFTGIVAVFDLQWGFITFIFFLVSQAIDNNASIIDHNALIINKNTDRIKSLEAKKKRKKK